MEHVHPFEIHTLPPYMHWSLWSVCAKRWVQNCKKRLPFPTPARPFYVSLLEAPWGGNTMRWSVLCASVCAEASVQRSEHTRGWQKPLPNIMPRGSCCVAYTSCDTSVKAIKARGNGGGGLGNLHSVPRYRPLESTSTTFHEESDWKRDWDKHSGNGYMRVCNCECVWVNLNVRV